MLIILSTGKTKLGWYTSDWHWAEPEQRCSQTLNDVFSQILQDVLHG